MRAVPALLLLALVAPLAAGQAPVFEPLWRAEVPAETEPHAPVVGDDLVLVTSSDGSMQAFQLRAGGQEAWRQQTGAQRLSPPMVHTSLFLVGGDDGRVRVSFLLSGEEMFGLDVGAPVLQNMSQTQREWIVLDESGRVSAYAKNDGSLVWRKEIGPGARSLQLREADGTFVVATHDDVILYELERRDQQERRTLPGILCIVESANAEVYALRAEGVHRLRETDYVDSWVVGTPAADCGMIDAERLYVPTRNGTVAALARTFPQQLWETPSLGAMPHILLLHEGWILATANGTAGERASVHLIDAKTGRVAGSQALQGAIASPPLRSRWSVGTGEDWGADAERTIEDYVVVRTDAGLEAFRLALPSREPPAAATAAPASPSSEAPRTEAGDEKDAPGLGVFGVLGLLLAAAAWTRRR